MASATLLFASAAQAQSSYLLSTLDSTPGSQWGIGPYSCIVAQQFTTGSQSESISSVFVDIGNLSDSGSDFTVSIHSNNSGSVGSLLNNGLLTGASVPTVNSVNEYSASGLTLDANISYWLVFKNTASDTQVRIQAIASGDTLVTDSSDGWTTLSTTTYSQDGGTSYHVWPDEAPLFAISSSTAVPEPTTLALAAVGGLGLLLFRRRK